MWSSSLRRRTLATGVLVVALVLGGLDVFLYYSMKVELRDNVDLLLQERAGLARSLGAELPPDQLAARLQAAGVRASIASAGSGTRLSAPFSDASDDVRTRRKVPDGSSVYEVVDLPDGSQVTVYASLGSAERTLERLRFLLLTGTLFGVMLAALLLLRASAVALRPLDDVVDAAQRIANGELGVRLRPERTTTEMGRIGAAFDEVTDALEAALDEARVSSELNQTFLADAAHQLRSPITAMRAAVEVLAMGLDKEGQERATAIFVSQSARAGELLSALLRMAKLDLGEAPQRVPADLEAICRSEVQRRSQLSPQLQIDLHSEAGPASPIELDPASMREVVTNLMDNARRHAVRRIDVRIAVVGDDIELEVHDDGAGMDAATAQRAFGRFVSFDSCGGTGLGLPIARAIVEAHGGTLVYENQRFVIRLPVERRKVARPARSDPPQLAST